MLRLSAVVDLWANGRGIEDVCSDSFGRLGPADDVAETEGIEGIIETLMVVALACGQFVAAD